MLRKIRKQLFSYATQSSNSAPKKRHSRRRKPISHDSESDNENTEKQRNVRSASQKSRRQSRSLSAGQRRDGVKGSQRDRQEGKTNRSAAPTAKTASPLRSGPSKRANSLPPKTKRKSRQTVDGRYCPSDQKVSAVRKSESSGEQLGKQKVATWLLGNDASWTQVPPLRSQRPVDRPRGPPGLVSSLWPAVTAKPLSQPIYVNQEFERPPLPLPHLPSVSSFKDGPLSGSFGNFALGQPSVPTKLPPHVAYFSPMQSAAKAAWSGVESRALVDAMPAKWPWTDPREHISSMVHSQSKTRQAQKELSTKSSVAVGSKTKSDSKRRHGNDHIKKKTENNSTVSKGESAVNQVKQGLLALKPTGAKEGLLPPAGKLRNAETRPSRRTHEKRHSRAKKSVQRGMTSKVCNNQGGERVGWEYHTIALSRVPVYGFGIAVSGGRDNPHFMNGDPSIAISDVLRAGPAEGKLMVNDRVISVNGVSLENVDYNQAISVLRECGNAVNLLIKRRALVTHANGNSATESNNNPIKVTLTKASKKDDFGIVLGCKIYVKEITNRVAVNEKDVSLQEGDIIHKINSTSIEGITLKEARKLLESCKEKVSLVVSRETSTLPNLINNRFLSENGNYINGHSRNGSGPVNAVFNNTHQRWPSAAEQPPTSVAANGKEDSFVNGHNDSATSANNIAAMANGRVSNGWNNQNLYVQPPTRAEYQQMNNLNDLSTLNESNEANDSNSTIGSRIRGPLADISLTQLDQPATPLLAGHPRPGAEATESSARPLPQRPAQMASMPGASPAKKELKSKLEPVTSQGHQNTAEIRHISFHKEGSVGIRLTGGNEVGIFVTAVQPDSPAFLQGLQVGDKILKANGADMKSFTREEAVLYLLRIQDKIELIVQNCKQDYESIVASQKGDSFYIRVHFNYDSDGKGELSFHVGDIFHVVDTLHNGVVGSWLVYRLGRNNQEIQKGSIPNKSRADELATEQKQENRSKKSLSGSELNDGSSRRGNFFKRRRSARRSKSLSKDHWEDVIFGDGSSKFSAYERVSLKNTGFTRPVVFFGPLADIAREKLLRDYPEKFACPQALNVSEEETSKSSKLASSGIVRLSSIKEVITTGKHALLDITPSAVDRLNYAQFYPIVIFMRAENKSIVKELRSRSSSKSTVHRSSRKLFEQSLKLEKLWHHIFTSSVNLTSGGDLWYKKLYETIEKQQSNTIWMAESKPEESISDDFLFPMISRLSYASSPESDLDISANDSRLGEDDNEKDTFGGDSPVTGRLVKASSDPSLAHPEQSPAVLGTESTDAIQKGTPRQENAKGSCQNNNSPSQRSPSKQLPLHILLRKELSKALHYESKDKDKDEQQQQQSKGGASAEELKQKRLSARLDEVGNYPTLRASEKYPQDLYLPKKGESPLPPPPPTSLPPSSFTSKVQQQYVEAPPRIDRNSKPSRFRSAHERLFGSKSIFSLGNSSSEGNYQNDDSDYINTISPAKYEEPPPPSPQKATPNAGQQRFVTGAFGDTSSYSSDSYNKYGSASSTLDTANRLAAGGEPYKPPRRTAPQLSHSSTLSSASKHSSLERNKPLPPPPFLNGSKVEPPIPLTSSFSKAPPSPPPKPITKFGTPSMQYQMNALTLNDTRPPPPPKPLNMPPPPVPGSMYDKQIQSDYDNMPAMLSAKRGQAGYHGALDISNGPPGYYQSLPQSSYAYHSKDNQPRYSSTAETISNFINGTGGNNINNNSEPTYNTFNSLRRPPSSYLELNGDAAMGKTSNGPGMSLSKQNYSSNYEHMRYNSISSSMYPNSASSLGYAPHNNGPYLNVPFPSKSPYSQDPSLSSYSMGNNHGQSSPLPPPPPLPTYPQQHLPNGGHVLQPTPQQPHSGQYLDLSLNRENRGSAFEVYRKPATDSMHAVGLSESPMFHGLPPPPPPLTVNDYNQPNYCNLDEIASSSMFASGGDGGIANANDATVIAVAHGMFDCQGGSLICAETGVSLVIPPGAISGGVSQEIYFKVCRDHSLAPPLDKTKGETLLSPIVMCGPRGLHFNVPIELRLPHCVDVDASWSVALKSSDTSNGEPAGWRHISMNNDGDGIASNELNNQFVTVLVDHF